MWFRKKNKQQEEARPEKKKTSIDKLVMGAIIGVAVGSVVGMTIAPQKGSDTRKMIADKSREALEAGKEMGKKFNDGRKVRKGLLSWLLGLIFGRKKGKIEPLKRIPSERMSEKSGSEG